MVSTNAFHSATPTRPSVDEKSSSAECSCASQLGIAVQSPGSCPSPSPSDQCFPCSAERLRQGGRVEQIPPENLKQWLVVSIYHMVTSSVHFVIHRSGHAPIFADAHQSASMNISHICGFQRNSCKNHFWCRGASLRPPIQFLSRAISRWRPISFGRHWIRFDRRRLGSSVHRTTFVISRFPL